MGYLSETWDGYDCLCLSVDVLIPRVGPGGQWRIAGVMATCHESFLTNISDDLSKNI